jgi:2-C-methyl-D-erythritol 4-phosphate cytidylyltransferase
MNYTEYALVVAGGKGARMKGSTAKQFLEISGLPVLMHTMLAFHRYDKNIKIILVLPENEMSTWSSLCSQYNFEVRHLVQTGGSTRFQSVKQGLAKIEGEGLVAIHDGVRPLVNERIIRDSFQLAKIKQTAVASVPLKESIRIVEGNEASTSVDRSRYRLIQTPQTFLVSMIQRAYEQEESPLFTDDASVVEKSGHPIALYEGSYENIKITTAHDLTIAQALLDKD